MGQYLSLQYGQVIQVSGYPDYNMNLQYQVVGPQTSWIVWNETFGWPVVQMDSQVVGVASRDYQILIDFNRFS